eukprot:UN00646
MNYQKSFKYLKRKWESENPWDLVLEELWCLLISNCIENSNVVRYNTKFGPDIVGRLNKFLGWNFPQSVYLQTEYGWLFQPKKALVIDF